MRLFPKLTNAPASAGAVGTFLSPPALERSLQKGAPHPHPPRRGDPGVPGLPGHSWEFGGGLGKGADCSCLSGRRFGVPDAGSGHFPMTSPPRWEILPHCTNLLKVRIFLSYFTTTGKTI